jgi:hypothetical protein
LVAVQVPARAGAQAQAQVRVQVLAQVGVQVLALVPVQVLVRAEVPDRADFRYSNFIISKEKRSNIRLTPKASLMVLRSWFLVPLKPLKSSVSRDQIITPPRFRDLANST